MIGMGGWRTTRAPGLALQYRSTPVAMALLVGSAPVRLSHRLMSPAVFAVRQQGTAGFRTDFRDHLPIASESARFAATRLRSGDGSLLFGLRGDRVRIASDPGARGLRVGATAQVRDETLTVYSLSYLDGVASLRLLPNPSAEIQVCSFADPLSFKHRRSRCWIDAVPTLLHTETAALIGRHGVP